MFSAGTYLLILYLLRPAKADCVGDTLNYTASGIFVPFKNLCGQDISISVDDYNSYVHVKDRTECLRRCVFRTGLCYGFDFLENGPATDFNCWLMSGEFTEQDTTLTIDNNAAMVLPSFISEYRKTCAARGLADCLQSQLKPIPATNVSTTVTTTILTLATSLASTSPSSSISISSSSISISNMSPGPGTHSGLSTGAKAGIGSAIGAALLLSIVAAVVVLPKRRKREVQDTEFDISELPEKCTSHAGGRNMVELENHRTQELRAQNFLELGGVVPMSRQRGITELQ